MIDGIRIIVPSRGRTRLCLRTVTFLGGNCDVIVAENDYAEYKEAGVPNLLTHPNNVRGIGRLRQWILDNVTDEIVLMVDDDIQKLYCLTHAYAFVVDNPLGVQRVIANCANCASDSGAHVFGFSQVWDVRKFRATDPFFLNTWLGGVIGFVGRDKRLRYLPNRMRADIDYCLQSLLYQRIVFEDARFAFSQDRFFAVGGNSSNRSARRDQKEIDLVLSRWGKYLSCSYSDFGTLYLKTDVPRKQTGVKL